VIKGITGTIALDKTSYSNGQIAMITMVDGDLSGSKQKVIVNIKSSVTDITGFDLILTETDLNSGIFTGAVIIGETTSKRKRPPILGCAAIDNIIVTYNDQLDNDGNPNLITTVASVITK
jgi:hypothetical protein